MEDPELTIVIPVYDDVEGLRRTLRSLASQRSPVRYETIVCDDCGPPGIADVAAHFGCRHVRLPVNAGSYAARNAGIKAAAASRIAFLDADQEVHPDWSRRGMEALELAPYAGGRIVVEAPPSADAWTRYDCSRGFRFATYLANSQFPTGNLFVLRSVFEETGLFDERFRSAGDTEFAARVRAAGFRIGSAQEAISYHPARNRRQVFAKNRRIAAGRAQWYVGVQGRRAWRPPAREALKVLLAPARVAWRVVTRRSERAALGWGDFLRFLVFDEIILVHRAAWLAFYCAKVARGSLAAFQDGHIGNRSGRR